MGQNSILLIASEMFYSSVCPRWRFSISYQ